MSAVKRSIVITFEDDDDVSMAVPPADMPSLLSNSNGRVFSNEMKFRKRLEDLRERFPQLKISGFVHQNPNITENIEHSNYKATYDSGSGDVWDSRTYAAPKPPPSTVIPQKNGRASQKGQFDDIASYSMDPSTARVQRFVDAHVAAVPISTRGRMAVQTMKDWSLELPNKQEEAVLTRDDLSVDSIELNEKDDMSSRSYDESTHSKGNDREMQQHSQLPLFLQLAGPKRRTFGNDGQPPSSALPLDTVTCGSDLHIKGEHKSTGNIRGKVPMRVRVGYILCIQEAPYVGREGIVVAVKDGGARFQIALYDLQDKDEELAAAATHASMCPLPIVPLSLSKNKKWWCGLDEVVIVNTSLESYIEELPLRRETRQNEITKQKGQSDKMQMNEPLKRLAIHDAFPSPLADSPREDAAAAQPPLRAPIMNSSLGAGTPTLMSSLTHHGGSFHRWMRRLSEFEPIPTDAHDDEANERHHEDLAHSPRTHKSNSLSGEAALGGSISGTAKSYLGAPPALIEELNFLRKENAKLRNELTASYEKVNHLEDTMKKLRLQGSTSSMKSPSIDDSIAIYSIERINRPTPNKRRVSVDRNGEPFAKSQPH